MKALLFLFFSVFFCLTNSAQVGIGTTTPDDSSILDITASDKGILVPRVSLSNVTNTMLDGVNTASTGLLIYNTNPAVTGGSGVGYYYFNSTTWERLTTSTDSSGKWSLSGDAGTTVGTDFIGTTDNNALSFRTNNVERLRITTEGKLEVYNTGQSVFLGELAGNSDNLSNNRNVAIGYNSLATAVNSSYNVAIGYQSQRISNSGVGNASIGSYSMYSLTTGLYNSALGADALRSITTGDYNIGIGSAAMYDNNIGSNNVGIGTASLGDNTSGNQNVALGFHALRENIIGNGSVAVGYQALYNNLADYSVAFGYQALFNNTTGTGNLGIGYNALRQNSTGSNNIAVGYSSLRDNTIGVNNVGIGYGSLYNSVDGSNNVTLGYNTLFTSTSSSSNVAIGSNAMYNTTSGGANAALGMNTLYNNTTGSNNTALGPRALFGNTTGNHNVGIGYESLDNNTTGSTNIGIGYQTGYSNITGTRNIFIGRQAGYSETGSNKLYIESTTADDDNALIYGEFDNNILRTNGILEMGQVGNGLYLEIENMGASNMGIDGDIVPYAGSATGFDLGNNTATEHWDQVVANGFVTYSDRNTKNEIQPLSYGLNEVLKLNPVTYRYKSFISPNNRIRMGLIAQEVENIIPEVVITEDVDLDENGNKIVSKGDYKAMNYTELIPVLIKSIQEQNNRIDQLEREIELLKKGQ
jgi:hypothetical protein